MACVKVHLHRCYQMCFLHWVAFLAVLILFQPTNVSTFKTHRIVVNACGIVMWQFCLNALWYVIDLYRDYAFFRSLIEDIKLKIKISCKDDSIKYLEKLWWKWQTFFSHTRSMNWYIFEHKNFLRLFLQVLLQESGNH